MTGIKAFLILTISLLAITAFGNASADDITSGTGNELKNYCSTVEYQNKSPDWYMCVFEVYGIGQGYTYGILNGLSFGEGHQASQNDYDKVRPWCAPKNATIGQDALVVTKYLEDHPESLTIPSVILVVAAFRQAWPCPTAK